AGGAGADVRFLPLDLPGAVRRFFDRINPRLAIVMETELWPNLFQECARRGVPLLLASARLSARSARRYGRLRGPFERTLASCALIAAQTEADAERFVRLGAAPDRTLVAGNLKFDFDVPHETLGRGRALRERYAPGRPVWVAGSTHEGEEQAALDAHARVRRAHADALLVLAPRHPPRFAEVAARLEGRGIAFARHSRGEACGPRTAVLLLDSLGELLDFYAAADAVFVGGSLVPLGGHNLLEPAALARAIVTGPHQANAVEIARLLSERGGARFVSNEKELGDAMVELLSSPPARVAMGSRARAVLEENRGALARVLALVEPLL
ncbi:MAG: 3-deoxy-D-manno-octulosonic acid transferase, partial [Steroidobacteraceae bacterium]